MGGWAGNTILVIKYIVHVCEGGSGWVYILLCRVLRQSIDIIEGRDWKRGHVSA